ncbi:MAG: chalcone isomerase family protein [Gammaproteobacteria bacterium]|nr:chalcone isomerase family protein [Gammaproteobacteria bacterium]MDH5735074.1 chalcone isomerase family protein [Gammaproteobacteria bacterium]
MKLYYLCALFFILLQPLQAAEIADRQFDDVIYIDGYQKQLQLNGIGIRYKFFFKIYIAALYLEEKSNDITRIIESDQAKRVLMHFVYDKVEKEKLVAAWLEGFEANLSKDDFKSLESRINMFNSLFETVETGDVVLLDFIPGKGTRVISKGQEKGLIEGADFYAALLKIWLGDEPVDKELKDALSGTD